MFLTLIRVQRLSPCSPCISRKIQIRPASSTSSPSPKTRGRPRKTAVEEDSTEIASGSSPGKRGRPRKVALEDFAEPATGKSSAPPKKRSRPEKVTLEDFAKPRAVKKPGNRFTPHPNSPEDKTELPPREDWRQIFSWVPIHDRVSISNPAASEAVANCFVPKGEKDRVIVEAFPGPGQLTRSLLALPKERIKKLIVLEGEPKYLDYLRPLADLDPRVTIIPYAASEWDTFDKVEEQGLLNDIETLGWNEGVHPQLQFISHLPITGLGEQLIAQFLRLIPNRNWLFKYGRVKMNLLLSEYVWQRLTAQGNSQMRCKLSVMADATADCRIQLFNELQPYADHFHPMPIRKPNEQTIINNRRIGVPFQAVALTPLKKQVIDPAKLDIWDYCVRRLFVRRATALDQCIEDLGPGAKSLLPKLNSKINTEAQVRELIVSDWAEVIREFDEWPFAPTDLGINDAMLDSYKGRNTQR